MVDTVDFATIKQQVNMTRLLKHYGLLQDMRQTASGLRGQCPFHDDSEPSFTTTPNQRGFHCFGCQAKGNVITFVRLKERIATSNQEQDDREAARRIQTWFGIEPIRSAAAPSPQPTDPASTTFLSGDDRSNGPTPPEAQENPPLPFTLESLDHNHPYLASRGLSLATIKHFGIGYFPRRGSMSGRIVIPIHNPRGQLVAYAGRWPAETPPSGTLRYKLPRGFHKSLELFNLHRISPHARSVILVEGYWSVFHLYQYGFRNVVALMGTSLSDAQCQLLCDRFQYAQVFLDGNNAGREASIAAGRTPLMTSVLAMTLIHLHWGR
jgi:DNA primase